MVVVLAEGAEMGMEEGMMVEVVEAEMEAGTMEMEAMEMAAMEMEAMEMEAMEMEAMEMEAMEMEAMEVEAEVVEVEAEMEVRAMEVRAMEVGAMEAGAVEAGAMEAEVVEVETEAVAMEVGPEVVEMGMEVEVVLQTPQSSSPELWLRHTLSLLAPTVSSLPFRSLRKELLRSRPFTTTIQTSRQPVALLRPELYHRSQRLNLVLALVSSMHWRDHFLLDSWGSSCSGSSCNGEDFPETVTYGGSRLQVLPHNALMVL
jgi:hypothetical protein